MIRGQGNIATKLFQLIVLCLSAIPAFANTIHVPADQPTIQAGINAANAGDTVLVAPGTYYENIDFKGKAITVTSSGGAAVTIIDGGGKPGVATVAFVSGEQSSSVISNFTIRGGGDALDGGKGVGGVFVNGVIAGQLVGASPIIQNNTITANYCNNIDIDDATVTIRNNEVSGVLQSTTGMCYAVSAIFLGGTPNYGVLGSSVIGNTIENNLFGSAINMNAAQNVLILNNIMRNNTSPDPGSAFTSINSVGTVVVQNLIYGNTSTCGGALAFENEGTATDGAYSRNSPSILIANNTIVDNVTPDITNGAGSECTLIAQIFPDPDSYGDGSPDEVILNNIVSGSTSYPAVNCYFYGSPNLNDQPIFQNDILNNAGGLFFGSYCVDVSNRDNNITSDPQFINRSSHDYHLQNTSPAVDAGENTALQIFQAMTNQNLTTDFDGNPRVQNATGKGCIIDIGAYEYLSAANACTTLETLSSSSPTSTAGQSITFTAQLSSSNGTPTGSIQFFDGTNVLTIQPVSSSGLSVYSTSSLSVGSHTITANFQPTGTFAGATAALTQVVTNIATSTVLTSSVNPSNVGQAVTFAAQVSAPSGTPPGTVTFNDGATALATEPVGAAGVATYTTSGLAAGPHTMIATYYPTGDFVTSSANLPQGVNGLPSVALLSVNPSTAAANSSVTLSVAVSAATPPGPEVPTRIVTFINAGTTLGSATLAGGTASFSLSNLPIGPSQLTCQYTGDAIYSPSNCNFVPVTITADATTLALTASLNPANALVPFALTAHISSSGNTNVPSGNIAFFSNGTPLGTAAINASGLATLQVSFPAGVETLTAAFAANSGFNAATSNAVAEVVLPVPTSITLSVSPTSASQNTPITLTAQVTALAGQALPTGSINFLDGTALLATVPLDATGKTVFTSSAFAAGTHSLIAVYSGNPNQLTSVAIPVTLIIKPQDFTLNAPPSLTLKTGHHADMSVSVVSVGGFADTINLSCQNLPKWATCTFSDAAPTLNANQTLPTSIHIDTDAILGYESEVRGPHHPSLGTGIALALLAPFSLLLSPRRRSLLKRSTLLLSLLVTASLLSLSGCSGLYPASTAPGTYIIGVSGSGVHSGLTHTATFTLIVTK